MAKYKEGFYLELSRAPFHSDGTPAPINNLSLAAFKLFIWMNELEHRYTTGVTPKKKDKRKQDWFYRSNEDLSLDTGLSLSTVKEAKKELVSLGFIQQWQMHFNAGEGKKSHEHVTAYRLLK